MIPSELFDEICHHLNDFTKKFNYQKIKKYNDSGRLDYEGGL